MNKMNYEDFEPLFGSAWAEKFRHFIEGEEMFKIYSRLKEDASKERVLPDSENVFKSFEYSIPSDIKCVIYLGDPYPRLYKGKIPQATGIPMDCSNSPDGRLQPSLEKFYDALDKEFDTEMKRSESLKHLLEQGVLLLNTDLTVKRNKSESHKGLWLPFQKYFLEEVMFNTTGIVYLLLGDSSRQMERYINPLGNYIFGGKKDKIEHPASASYKHTDWDSKGVFKKINHIFKSSARDEIFWDRKVWEGIKDLPF